ncbi:MAG TPA: hypothetical protein VFX21_14560 [Acidimicrobiia bacterium]|nr:hypothetical protein [Acidimicrobiia bacterium]
MAEHTAMRLDAENNCVLARCSTDTSHPHNPSVRVDADPDAEPTTCPYCLQKLTAIVTIDVKEYP